MGGKTGLGEKTSVTTLPVNFQHFPQKFNVFVFKCVESVAIETARNWSLKIIADWKS